ncbi:MAG: ribonuclease E/G, partial [Gammaproteobacteria bacterium]
ALITIDINSSKATKGNDIEDTALQTNLEAADEIATQLRIRDLGGLIVIDYIDMLASKNQRAVENRLREAVKVDRARVQIGKISRFGLLEMSRQRIRPALAESSHELCPRCEGVGAIRNTQSTALAVLRIIEEESMKDSTAKIAAQVSIDVATFLTNEKRQDIGRIEEGKNISVLIIPNQNLETPHYDIERIKGQDVSKVVPGDSYDLVKEIENPSHGHQNFETPKAEQPAVKELSRSTPKPQGKSSSQNGPGLISRIFSLFFAAPERKKESKGNRSGKPVSRDNNRRPGSSNNRGRRNSQSGDRQQGSGSRSKSNSRSSGNRNNNANRSADGGGRQRNHRKDDRRNDFGGNKNNNPNANQNRRPQANKDKKSDSTNAQAKEVNQNQGHNNPSPTGAKSEDVLNAPNNNGDVESKTSQTVDNESTTEINYNVSKPAATTNTVDSDGNVAQTSNDGNGATSESPSSTAGTSDPGESTKKAGETNERPAKEDPVQPSMFDNND